MPKLQEKPSALKKEHPALHFCLLDPDPDCESGSRYGSREPIESGSTTQKNPSVQDLILSVLKEPQYLGPPIFCHVKEHRFGCPPAVRIWLISHLDINPTPSYFHNQMLNA